MEHVTDSCECVGQRCTQCQRFLCIGAYEKQSCIKRGTRGACRTCRKSSTKEINKRYRERHREEIRAKAEARKEYDKEYREKHREERNAKNREWNHFNIRNNEVYYRAYRERNAAWRQNNPQRVLELNSVHAARYRTQKTRAGGSFTAAEWGDLKSKYNYCCLCCGRREPEIKLTADHIVPVIKDGTSYIDNIQPLCKSCNSRKGAKTTDFRPKYP